MDDTSKREKSVPLCSPWTKRIRKFEWLSVFIKHKKITTKILKGDLIDSKLGEILSVTTEVKTEYPSYAFMHSTTKTAAIATIMWKPWIVRIVRIVAIVQSNFWTMVAIVMIIWKPGYSFTDHKDNWDKPGVLYKRIGFHPLNLL